MIKRKRSIAGGSVAGAVGAVMVVVVVVVEVLELDCEKGNVIN